jgi:hypothetical protein
MIYGGCRTERMTYARVVIVLRLYLLVQCLNPVLRTSIKTCNFVTFYKFLIHLGVHHTNILQEFVVHSTNVLTYGLSMNDRKKDGFLRLIVFTIVVKITSTNKEISCVYSK